MTATARSVEGLVGAGIGALGGLAAGGISYESKDPKEWIDDDGLTYARPYSPQEKAERRKRMLTAALIGAGVGGGASIGGSVIRRGNMAAAEAEAAPAVASNYLRSLRKLVTEAEGKVTEVDAAGRKVLDNPEVAGDIVRGKKLLTGQQGKLRKLLDDASKARDSHPWGGFPGPRDAPPHEELTHEGQIARHFENLRDEHGLPPMREYSGALGKSYFKKLLELQKEKKASISIPEILAERSPVASASFYNELRKIDAHARG